MHKIKRFLELKWFFLICFFLCQLGNIWAAGKEAVDVFCTGDNNIRILLYDIKDQKLKEVHDLTSASQETLQGKIDEFVIPHLKINTTGDVVFQEGFEHGKYMVRTSGEVDVSELDVVDPEYDLLDIHGLEDIYERKYKTLFREGEIKPGKQVLEYLNSPEKKMARRAPLAINLFPGPVVARNLENSENPYLCAIGETVTELTMLSFGYDQLYSKYEDNHGLDGVFIDSSETPECFITESKCWKKSQTASKTMEKLLSEDEIYRKIQVGITKGGVIQKSMSYLEEFIVDNPTSVFKFAHRSVHSGHSQRALESINHTEYMRLSGRETINSLAAQLKKLSVVDLGRLKGLLPDDFFV